MSARSDRNTSDREEHVLPALKSYLYFGQPLIALALSGYVLVLADGIDLGLMLFYLLMACFAGLTAAWALLTARRVVVSSDHLIVQTVWPVRIVAPLHSIRSLQLLDRGGLGRPRRILRVVTRAPHREFFITDAVIGFDQLIAELRSRAGQAESAPLSRWERIWLLQWGL